jgi:hypothetical protein
MTTRLYTVTNKATGEQRLIDANHPSVALGHVARDEFTVVRPSPKEAAELVAAGIKVESAA